MSTGAVPPTATVVVCALRKLCTRPFSFASQPSLTTTLEPTGTRRTPPENEHGKSDTTCSATTEPPVQLGATRLRRA
jgi:hypothetical protein